MPAVPAKGNFYVFRLDFSFLKCTMNMCLLLLILSAGGPTLESSTTSSISGFFTPRKNHVVLCEAHKNFTKTSEETEQKQAKYEQHIKSKDRAREEMKRDGERAKLDPSTGTFSLSLQQVLTTPYGNVSTLYYKRKFSSYNLTMAINRWQEEEVVHMGWRE